MRRDDVRAALDAMASDVAPPTADADRVIARGRNRVRRRRVTLSSVAAVLLVAAVSVGAVARSDNNQAPASKPPIPTGEPSASIAVVGPKQAWKCNNPLEYTDDGGRTWRKTELPGVQNSGVSCTAIADGTAWAIGGDGAGHLHLLRIRDGGKHVDAFDLPAAIDSSSYSAPQFVDADHGWLVISSRTAPGRILYRTTDGGASWTQLGPARVMATPSFENTETGWSTNGSAVLRTTDGGSIWRVVHYTSSNIFSVNATSDGAVAWAGIQDGPVQFKPFFDVSTDSGRTWTQRAGPAGFERANGQNLFSVADANHWALVSGNWLRVTDDAGRTWETRPDVPLTDPLEPRSMAFPTAQVGWMTDDAGRILRTTDGGWSWGDVTAGGTPTAPKRTPQAPPTPQNAAPLPIAFLSSSEGWECSVPMQYTKNAGAAWRNIAIPGQTASSFRTQEPLCAAVRGGEAWTLTPTTQSGPGKLVHITGAGGSRLRTQVLDFPDVGDVPVSDLAFANDRDGVAPTGDGMLVTRDGGHSWLLRTTNVTGNVQFTSTTEGWAGTVGGGPHVTVLHTTDAGATWQPVALNDTISSGTFTTVVAARGDTILVGATEPTSGGRLSLEASTDDGHVWQQISLPEMPVAYAASALGVTDATNWQLAVDNDLWTTNDGGQSWQHVAQFAALSDITDVAFPERLHGFVSGPGGGDQPNSSLLLETTDGGDAWATIDGNAPPLPHGAAVINFPGGIIGCPTRPLTTAPAGNPPAGLVDAAKRYVEHGTNGWTPNNIEAYHLGDDPPGSFGYLFRYQISSCGPATMTNAWVVEMHGAAIDHRAYLPRAYLAFAHYADGWQVFGSYP